MSAAALLAGAGVTLCSFQVPTLSRFVRRIALELGGARAFASAGLIVLSRECRPAAGRAGGAGASIRSSEIELASRWLEGA